MTDVNVFPIIITLLLTAISIMSGVAMFWIRHYIKRNDADHDKLYTLIDGIKNHLMELKIGR